jgi:2-methylcitrate dehydratase PrpD
VLTALFDLVERHDVAFDDIKTVRLALSQTPFDMHGGFSTYKAKFEAMLSAHYVAAVYLRDRALTLAQFEPSCYNDPGLRKFAAETVAVVANAHLKEGQCIADIVTKEGKPLTARCDHPLGAPENPGTRQQIEEKFRTYAPSRLTDAQTEGIIEAVAVLEQLDSATSLIQLLRR